MRVRAGVWLAVVPGVVFAWGMLHFLGIEYASGDVYPALSSLRADEKGSRLLFESLAAMPGLTVTRNYLPVELFEAQNATVLYLGLSPHEFGKEMAELRHVRQLAESGNRVVLAFRKDENRDAIPATKLNREWDVRLGEDARGLYFKKADGWDVTESAGAGVRPTAIERAFGKGRIEIVAQGELFDNESTAAMGRLDAVTRALGDHARIVFDEQHFGITQSGSIAGLARRFRLMGLALGLIGCALLWIWRNATSFPPAGRGAAADRMAGRTAASGLVTLLRKHVAEADVAGLCWREWVSANRKNAPAGATKVLASAAGPVEKMRELHGLAARAPKGAL